MAGFKDAGLRAVLVHSGDTSAPRAQSLEELAAGHLDVFCAVDIFNEASTCPNRTRWLMLRPTDAGSCSAGESALSGFGISR